MNTASPATTKPAQQVATSSPSLIQVMAAQYNMDPVAFSNAVKKTAMPGAATNEEFAAFMMVAYEYKLNPLLKEIYAFPKKGGGIVPMVSIDGWVNIINSHSKLAGFSFEMQHDDKGNLVACTCTMQRTDRTMPTVVTEYLAECIRNTDPWKMKYRMLRHKALIQAARYCFGLSGIQDEDEARDTAMRDITPPPRPEAKDFVIPAKQEHITEDGEIIDQEQQSQPQQNQPTGPQSGDAGEALPAGSPEHQAIAGDATTTEEPDEIWNAGWFARLEGTPLMSPPEGYTAEEIKRWKNGWNDCDKDQKSKGK